MGTALPILCGNAFMITASAAVYTTQQGRFCFVENPSPQPPPRNGEGEKKKRRLACSPSPLRRGGWGEGFSTEQPSEDWCPVFCGFGDKPSRREPTLNHLEMKMKRLLLTCYLTFLALALGGTSQGASPKTTPTKHSPSGPAS